MSSLKKSNVMSMLIRVVVNNLLIKRNSFCAWTYFCFFIFIFFKGTCEFILIWKQTTFKPIISRFSSACLCATYLPTMWVFGKPLIPAGPWSSQQDLKHLSTPHDCHHLCIAFSTGNCPPDHVSRWGASGHRRNIIICFSWTQWEYIRCTILTFCFFSPPTLVFLSFSKNSGMDQTRISLIWPFSAVFLFIRVLF